MATATKSGGKQRVCYFYDADTGQYTVKRWLDDLRARFGTSHAFILANSTVNLS